MKTTWSLIEVANLLGVEPAQAHELVALVYPPNRDGFEFQDLVLLRAARVLQQQLTRAKLVEALKSLQSPQPEGAESGLTAGDDQRAFSFSRPAPSLSIDAEVLFAQAVALEEQDPAEAVDRYTEALAQNPRHADAHVNLGRLLHTRGRLREAEAHYVAALVARPDDGTATFNLAVALEDMGRLDEAIARYTEALTLDAGCVDAYFNLSRLYEKKGEKVAALRHLKDYRRLIRSS